MSCSLIRFKFKLRLRSPQYRLKGTIQFVTEKIAVAKKVAKAKVKVIFNCGKN